MLSDHHNGFAQSKWRAVSPGRVNLLGEHVDYNQGVVLPAAIDRFVELKAEKREDRRVVLIAKDLNDRVCFSLDDLNSRSDIDGNPLPGWALYPAGVAWVMQNAGYTLSGLEGIYTSDIPIGAGLSSSAAVETVFAVMWQALGAFEINRMQLALLCQQAENQYVGVKCGLMDQFACAHGVARHALYFDVRSLEWQPMPLPHDTVIVIADSGVRRQLAGSQYNQRREACEQAVEILKGHVPAINSLRDIKADQFDQYRHLLPEIIEKRARHVIEEIKRVEKASLCLVQDDGAGFGALMYAGHVSLRDLYEVSIPELDMLVDTAMNCEGCLGARMTGAGFGGCTVNLVREANAKVFSETLKKTYLEKFNKQSQVYVCQPTRCAHLA